ncbi:hypothetical protein GGR56DRAFT_241261 [Xylariaceae sp. FL0804]|nr:hypothetical protein GGR56DRAFT_241261 [Xylariaceae sp. FL0804]
MTLPSASLSTIYPPPALCRPTLIKVPTSYIRQIYPTSPVLVYHTSPSSPVQSRDGHHWGPGLALAPQATNIPYCNLPTYYLATYWLLFTVYTPSHRGTGLFIGPYHRQSPSQLIPPLPIPILYSAPVLGIRRRTSYIISPVEPKYLAFTRLRSINYPSSRTSHGQPTFQ